MKERKKFMKKGQKNMNKKSVRGSEKEKKLEVKEKRSRRQLVNSEEDKMEGIDW